MGNGMAINAAADQVVLLPSATVGLNTVINAVPLGAGDEVISLDIGCRCHNSDVNV